MFSHMYYLRRILVVTYSIVCFTFFAKHRHNLSVGTLLDPRRDDGKSERCVIMVAPKDTEFSK